MKHELEMARGTGGDEFSEEVSGDWINEGWSSEPPKEDGADATVNEAPVRVPEKPRAQPDKLQVQPLLPLGYVEEVSRDWTLRGMVKGFE